MVQITLRIYSAWGLAVLQTINRYSLAFIGTARDRNVQLTTVDQNTIKLALLYTYKAYE